MKRKIFIQKWVFFLGFFVIFSSCAMKNPEPKKVEFAMPKQYNPEIAEEKKLALARERFKEASTIRRADYLMSKNNPREAIELYLSILAKLPEDIILHKKVANAYFLLKNWSEAYKHFVYVPIKELSDTERKNMILALFYREDFLEHSDELAKFAFTSEEKAFYEMMVHCYAGMSVCIEKISAYE